MNKEKKIYNFLKLYIFFSMHLIKSKIWFTLIELMFAITIFMIVVWATYMNFSYYQNKMNLKLTSKDVSQALYSARNLAVNWLDSSSWNVSVWVYFDNSLDSKNKITFFTYPYDLDISWTDLLTTTNKKLLKSIDFHQWIELNDIWWRNKALFLFEAISWSGSYYYWDSTPWKKVFTWSSIDIKISFMWTNSPVMSKSLKYIIWTNIVDY